jgi:hypothetical protein
MNALARALSANFVLVVALTGAHAQDASALRDPMAPKVSTHSVSTLLRQTDSNYTGLGALPALPGLPQLPGSSVNNAANGQMPRRMALMGVFVSDKKKVAIIDSRTVEVGDLVSGFEVKSITQDGVDLVQGSLAIRLSTVEKTDSIQMEMIKPPAPEKASATSAKKQNKKSAALNQGSAQTNH